MKVEAYLCDCGCGKIVSQIEAIGVSTVDDLFDKLSSYPSIYKPEKAEVHYSVSCYNEKVAIPASNIVNRKKDEKGYELKLRELGYGLRAQCIKNHRDRIRNKKLG